MANISITGTDFLESGTSGDDAVTFDTTRTGAPDANIGNGGMDSAVLGGDTLAALAGAGLDFGTSTADTWTIGGGGNTFDVSFTSLTTSDGITLVAGTALSGVSDPTTASTVAGDGSYTADALTAANYAWSGTALTLTPTTTVYKVVSVDGTAVTTGTTFGTADGSITVVDADEDMSGISKIAFTPNTSALAGSNNVGDQLTFTYPVVLEDASGGQITVQQSYTITVDWTAGNDTLDVSNTSSQAAVTAMGAIFDGGGLTLEDGTVIAGGPGLDLGDDTIQGSNFDDNITGGDGSDTIKGGNGDDTISDTSSVAGETNVLGGGAGADTITAGGTGDKVIGAGGNDTLIAGGGGDALQGGGGADTITAVANGGNNTIRGGDGDDIITGGAGNDEIRGGDGMDTIAVTGGSNIVYTSKGTGDTIDLTGGGLDTIVFKNGTETTTVTAFNAAAGDSVDVSGIGYTTFAEVLANAYQTAATGGAPDTTVILSDDSSLVLTGVTLTTLVDGNFDYA